MKGGFLFVLTFLVVDEGVGGGVVGGDGGVGEEEDDDGTGGGGEVGRWIEESEENKSFEIDMREGLGGEDKKRGRVVEGGGG